MKKIGIIGAMDQEVRTLKSLMNIEKTVEKASLKFYEGKLEGKDIVLVQCGIGKVNSALCAQILISEFKVDAVVNTGVAGAIHSSLGVNDIVISTEAIQYDVDATAFGYSKGQIPQMDNSVFVADESLINAAYESSLEQVKGKGFNIVKGRVATGDIFISSKELKEELKLSKYVFQRAIKELSNTDLIVITGNGRGRAYSKSLTKLELYVGVQKLADRLRMGN